MKGMTQIVEILSALFLTEIVQGILKFEIKEVKQICNLFSFNLYSKFTPF